MLLFGNHTASIAIALFTVVCNRYGRHLEEDHLMYVVTKEGVTRLVAHGIVLLRSTTGAQREEAAEFIFFAREWLRMGDFAGAYNALRNAESIFRPLWKTERFKRAQY